MLHVNFISIKLKKINWKKKIKWANLPDQGLISKRRFRSKWEKFTWYVTLVGPRPRAPPCHPNTASPGCTLVEATHRTTPLVSLGWPPALGRTLVGAIHDHALIALMQHSSPCSSRRCRSSWGLGGHDTADLFLSTMSRGSPCRFRALSRQHQAVTAKPVSEDTSLIIPFWWQQGQTWAQPVSSGVGANTWPSPKQAKSLRATVNQPPEWSFLAIGPGSLLVYKIAWTGTEGDGFLRHQSAIFWVCWLSN